MDWQISDDEEGEGPLTLEPERAAPPRRWGKRWLLLPLLLVAVVVGAIGWQQRRNDERIRADFTAIVHDEARLLATRDLRALDALVYPDQPREWVHAYESQGWGIARTLPIVSRVAFSRDREEALVTLRYPWPEGPAFDGLPAAERQQAYRRYGGQWRRYPLALDTSPRVEQRSSHFVLRGPADALTALEAQRFATMLEAIHRHVASEWPADLLWEQPIPIEVRPQEFASLTRWQPLDENPTAPILINTPALYSPDLGLPLSTDSQYRLFVTERVVARLTGPRPTGGPVARPFLHVSLEQSLRRAQARGLALSDEEQRRVREGWRAALSEGWQWPLDRATDLPHFNDPALDFLAEYVRLSHGDAALGRVAARLTAAPSNAALGELLAEATGTSVAALEEGVRQLATTPER